MKRMIGTSILVVLGIALFLSAGLFFVKHRSAKPEEFLKKARLEAQNKAYYAASLWYKLVIQAFPKSSQVVYAYLKKAEAEEKAGYPELAYWTYQKYAQVFPDQIQEPDLTWLLGRLAFAAGEWDNAIFNFKKLQAEHPRFHLTSEVKRRLAQSYYEKSKLYPQGEKRNELRRLSADLFFSELRRTPNEETLKMVTSDLQFIQRWIQDGQNELAAEALALIEKRIKNSNEQLVFLDLKIKLEKDSSNSELLAQVESFLQAENLKEAQEGTLKASLASLYLYEADRAYQETKWKESAENYSLALGLETSEQNRSWCYRQLLDIALRTNSVDLFQKMKKQLEKESFLDRWLQDEIDFDTLIKQHKKMKSVLTAF